MFEMALDTKNGLVRQEQLTETVQQLSSATQQPQSMYLAALSKTAKSFVRSTPEDGGQKMQFKSCTSNLSFSNLVVRVLLISESVGKHLIFF